MKVTDTNIRETAHRELAAGVLNQAEQDLRRFHRATSSVEQKLYQDAYRWVMSDDCSWPFAFQNVCRALNRAPEHLREELTGNLSVGPFGRSVRRFTRAARRSLNSLRGQVEDNNLSTSVPAQLAETWH